MLTTGRSPSGRLLGRRYVGDYRSCRPAASAAGSSIWNKRSEGRKLRSLLWVALQGHKPVDSESESNDFFLTSLYRCRCALPIMTSLRSLFIYAPILFIISSSALISVRHSKMCLLAPQQIWKSLVWRLSLTRSMTHFCSHFDFLPSLLFFSSQYIYLYFHGCVNANGLLRCYRTLAHWHNFSLFVSVILNADILSL